MHMDKLYVPVQLYAYLQHINRSSVIIFIYHRCKLVLKPTY